MNEDRWNKYLVVAGLPVIVLLFYWTAVAHFSYTPDDTYIYLQFARNVLHGNGMSFNAGEPTYGFTSPLWLLLISLGGSLGVNVYVAAKALDLLIASASLILFYLAAFEMIRDVAVTLLATLSFSLNIWLIRWAGSGMETSLSVFLLLAVLLFCLRNNYLLSATINALLTLVRPEASLLFPLLLVDIYMNSVDKRRAVKSIVIMIVTFLGVLIPWCMYAYHTFGTFVPNTFRAKSALNVGSAGVAHEIWDSLKILLASDGVMLFVLVTCGIILLRVVRTTEASGQDTQNRFFLFRQSIVGISWLIVLPSVYGILHIQVVSRYLMLVVPVIGMFAFSYLFQTLSRTKFQRYSYGLVVVLTGLSLLQSQTAYHMVVKPGVEAFAQGMESTLVSIGGWLKNNSDPGDVVMAWDIGAVGYYSERKICDAAGLVNPEMIQLTREGHSFDQIIRQQLYAPFCHPSYIVHRSEQPEELASNVMLFPVLTRPFYRIGLMKTQLVYYTLYKVRNDPVNSLKAQ